MNFWVIHFRSKRWLWAGLINGSQLLRVCRCSFSCEIPKGDVEQDKEITGRDGRSRTKQTKREKKLPERKKVEGTTKKKAFKRVLQCDSRLLNPLVSFPFDGSNYSEIDDKFNVHHYASMNQTGYSADTLLVQRMDNYRSEGRFYRILSADASVLYPSVTTILSNTPTRPQYYRLRNWEKSMIKQHGEEQFKSIQQLTKDVGAQFHRELEKKLFKIQLSNAISIKPHTCISDAKTTPSEGTERNLTDKIKTCETQISEYLKSVEHVLKQISNVLALESVVVHHELGYTGTCDCIAKYRGEVCLIDWKSSEKQKPTLSDCYDFPLQAVAYAGAVNHDDHYPFKVFSALIVVAYANGAPAHAHFLSYEECQFYWNKWLHRLQEYKTQFASDHNNIVL